MTKPFITGITGGSGSGKTFFIKKISEKFSTQQLCVISQDHYYKPRETQPVDENGITNFDLPQCIDRESLYSDVLKLKSGENVIKKEYTFNNPNTKAKALRFDSTPLIIVEGLFVQYFQEINELLDLKIFLVSDPKIKLERRITRDGEERGYDKKDVIYRFENHVLPIYKSLIEPLMFECDIVIPNNKNFNQALSIVTSYLKSLL